MKLFEKAEPGESIQVEVKYVQIAGRWAFQYTALDDYTRFRVLRLYRRLHHGSSVAFLAEVHRAFPFPIKRLQCDHGQEFSFAFVLGVEAAGIRHRYIQPRRPSRTAKSSGTIGSIRRSSGAVSAFKISRRRPPFGAGRTGITTVLPGAPGPHPGRETCRSPATAAGRLEQLMAPRDPYQKLGVNLDETQQMSRRDWPAVYLA